MRSAILIGAITLTTHGLLSHPADINLDASITAEELLSYTATSSDADSRQQAENIWKHGGAYTTNTELAADVAVPFVGGASYTPIAEYVLTPYTAYAIDLPAELEDLTAHFYLSENESVLFAAALGGEDSEGFIALPAHPESPLEGGTVYLELTENLNTATEAVHPIGFVSIAPIPVTNAGSFNQLLTAANNAISHLESIRGIDYSDYFVGGPSYNGAVQDDAEAIEIAAVRALQDPGLEGSVVSAMSRLNANSADPAVLMAQLDAAFDYEPVIAVAELLPTQLTATTDGPSASAFSANALSGPAPAPPAGRTFAPPPEITTGASLAYFMREQYVAEEMLKNPIFSNNAGVANTALGLAGPIGEVASASVGLTTVVLQLGYERKAGTYPSSAQLIPFFPYGEFFQDDCGEVGEWECEAVATSNGWQADKVLLDLALNFIRILGGVAEPSGPQTLLSSSRQSAIDFGVDSAIKDLGQLTSVVAIDPDTWNIPSITNPYVEMVQVGNVATIDQELYFPENFGSSTVFIAARGTGDAAFPPGRVEPSATETVTLNEAQITLSGEPPTTYVAGETYTITAEVANVRETAPSISWQATGGSLGTPTTLPDGRSQVDWTAPDPASGDIITITANLDLALCYPLDSEPISTQVLTSGGRYRIKAEPLKGCYEIGDDISITFEDRENPNAQPVTDFNLTGPGTLLQTGPNTATISYDGVGSVGLIASLEDNPSRFDSADFVYGCADFELNIVELPNDNDILTATVGDVTLNLIGTVTNTANILTATFSAQTNYNLSQLPQYQEALANWQAGGQQGDPPDEPVLGDVGIIGNGGVFNDPNFEIRIVLPYFTDNCNQPAIPPIIVLCYYEVSQEQTTVVTQGITGDYVVDPALAATSTSIDIPGAQTTFTVYLVPDN